jgi:cleavage and polyadenylation specificity factor subunit 1
LVLIDLRFSKLIKSFSYYRWQQYLQEIKPTYWLFVYRDSGTLEVYSLPELRLSYLIRNFGFGQNILHDSMEFTTVQGSQANESVNPEVQVNL